MNKTNRLYTICIPTKAYLKKYIQVEYGTIVGTPIKLDYLTTLGTLILCLLENDDFSINMNNSKKESRIQYMNDEINFTAPLNTMRYKGHSLSKDRIIAINRHIENEFIRELSFYCKTNLKNRAWRPGIKEAIYSFCEKYGIDVEIDVTFEALKKSESRYRERKEKKSKNISQTSVPPPQSPLSSLFFPAFRIA
jgi:hypothetical protein